MLMLNLILAALTQIEIRTFGTFIPYTNYRSNRTAFTLNSLMLSYLFSYNFVFLISF
jgi:hypothetical protein